MDKYTIISLVILCFVIFFVQSIRMKKKTREKIRRKIEESWGNISGREYEYNEFDNITHFYKKWKEKNDNKYYVDDITWNDIDMDTIFMMLNSTNSSAGEEYLYKILRIPCFDEKELLERDRIISFFEENKEKAFDLEEQFALLGKTKKISLSDFIYRLADLGHRSNISHFIKAFLFLGSIVSLFINPIIGLIALITMLFVNVSSYYKEKAEIESYFICFKYMVEMINCGERICKINIEEIKDYNTRIQDSLDKLSSLKKGIAFLSMNNGDSIGEVVMEYLRMLLHVDIIKFNSMLHDTIENIEYVEGLFETLGAIESAISIASFRTYLPYYTKPKLDKLKPHIEFNDIYHPMINEPVVNSLKENRSVLITGSNASGKSTFLKTVAINAILSQTIYTCTAKEYVSSFYKIFSSMALRDDLESAESYYIVEIKSLKRIIDNIDESIPLLCFIDEVLRGTNTVERIAASSYILKTISCENALCFAATHDIELTEMINEYYSNYHFTEEICDDDVKFNYKLFNGKATSRNAIKLLNVIGFNNEIVQNAEKIASAFITTGNWNKL